ncbi:MAG: hypothetical protein CSA33_00250 [Desulfobulbus propionicus]|nr:MAG: hypothetical protein CSA33_00250 [Desulfobulbus propionicus]
MKKSTSHQLILESLEERVFFDANPVIILEPADGGLEPASPDGAALQAESDAAAGAEEPAAGAEESAAGAEAGQADGEEKTEGGAAGSGEVSASDDALAEVEGGQQKVPDTPVEEPSSDEGNTVAAEQSSDDTLGTESPAAEEGATVPVDPFVGEDFTFTVSFDNTTGNPTVYGPYIDLVLDGGLDGTEASNDGISFVGATYLGAEVQHGTPQTVDATGSIIHPYAKDAAGDPLVVTGLTEGDVFVSLLMPFGSFAGGQPPAEVEVTAHMSENADVGTPLDVDVITGAMYGTDPLDNPTVDNPLRGPGDGLQASTQSFLPEVIAFNTDINVASVDSDCQEQHGPYSDSRNVENNHQEIPTGPNFPAQYITTIDIADTQEVGGQEDDGRTGMVYTQHVSTSVFYLGNVSVVDSSGNALAYTILNQPVGSAGGDLVLQLHDAVTGTGANDDVVITYDFYVPENTGDAVPTPILDPVNADDEHIINDGEITYLWDPTDSNDDQVIATVDAEVDKDGVFSNAPDIDDISHAEAITIQKDHELVTDIGSSGYTPGDTVEFTLDFQISDYFAFGDDPGVAGDDFGIVDSVYNGLKLEDDAGNTYQPEITIWEDGQVIGSMSLTAAAAGSMLWTTPGNNGDLLYHYNLHAILAAMGVQDGILSGGGSNGPTHGQITYSTTIQNTYALGYNYTGTGELNVDQGDYLSAGGTTDVEIFGDVYEEDGQPPGFTGESESDESCDGLGIVTGSVGKDIYAINGVTDNTLWERDDSGRVHISAGDVVSYRITYALPTSSTEDFELVDYLPSPVFDATDPDLDGPLSGWQYSAVDNLDAGYWFLLGGAGNHTYVPNHQAAVADSANNSVTFHWDDYHDIANNAQQVSLILSVKVDDAAFTDGLFLTNQVTGRELSTEQEWTETNAIIQIVLDEPELEITKGVVETNNSAGILDGPSSLEPGFVYDANLSGIDAGDLVTYCITVENVGQAAAYDVFVEDSLPNNFAYYGGLSVTDGDGNPVNYTVGGDGSDTAFFTDGMSILDPIPAESSANHEDMLYIWYNLVALDSVGPGVEYTNTAEVTNYAVVSGGDNFVANTDLTDDADVTIAAPLVEKTVTGTNQSHTQDLNVAIGEIVTYKVEITVPEGETQNVFFYDTLDDGLALVAVDSISASPYLATTQTSWNDILTNHLIVDNDGTTLSLDFGTITNSNRNNGAAEKITLTYTAVVTNVAGNQRGTDLENDAEWHGNGKELATDAASVNVVEPQLEVEKTVSDPNPDEGDLVTFEIVVTNETNANGADAFEVVLTDVLPTGYNYVPGSWNVSQGLPPDSINDTNPQNLEVTWNTFAQGESATITFAGQIGAGVVAGTDLTNTASVNWSSLPGDQTTAQSTHNTVSTERTGDPTDPGGNANDYSVEDDAQVMVAGAIDKVLSSPGTEYTIGDMVTYTITVTLPESQVNDFHVIDALPTGLVYQSHTVDSNGFSGTLPSETLSQNSNQLDFNFGSFQLPANNDPTDDSFTIEVVAQVGNSPSNLDGQTLTNHASMSYEGPSGSDVIVDDPTDPQIQIVEPWIETEKTVTPSGGNIAEVGVGDTLTYTVTLTNGGNATAYEVNFSDTLAPHTTFGGVVSATIDGLGVSLGTTGDPNNDGSLITFEDESWDLDPGSVLKLIYTATVNDDAVVDGHYTNTVDADWSSQDGTVGTERVYDEDDGIDSIVDSGHYADRDVDTATFSIPGVTISKIDNTASALIGEEISYVLTISSPQGTVSQLSIADVLGAGLVYNNNAQISYDNGMSWATNMPVVGGTNDGTAEVTLTWDLGDTLITSANHILIRYTAQVANVTGNTSGSTLANTVTLEYEDLAGDTQSSTATESFVIRDPLELNLSIGDRVWYDLDADGVQDASEVGLSNITVTLFSSNGYEIAQVDTDSSGNYLFSGLSPNDYYVVVDAADLPSGMVQTWDYDDTDPAGTFTTPHASGIITLQSGQSVFDIDFGYTGTGTIGEKIWEDSNGNTVDDPGEVGIAGVTVTVTGDFNNDGDLDDPGDVMTTITDENGYYSFTNLPYGTYTVEVDTATLPVGMEPTTDGDGLGTPNSVTGLLNEPVNNNFNFGYQQNRAIGDYVWNDLDGDGIQDANESPLANVQVTLSGDFDGDGDRESLTTTTDETGHYLFDVNNSFGNLFPGEYVITIDPSSLPEGMVPTYDNDGLASPHSSTLILGISDVNLEQDFGYRETGSVDETGSIGDTVWYDLDGDGVIDAGEEGIAGVTVTLTGDTDGDGIDDVYLQTVTGQNGNYFFEQLVSGEYTVSVDTSTADLGDYTALSPTYDPDGELDMQTTVNLGPGEINTLIDFGYLPSTDVDPVPPPPEEPFQPVVPPTQVPVTGIVPTGVVQPVEPFVFSYDPVFHSLVEGDNLRDVDSFLSMRDEELPYSDSLLPVCPMYSGHAEPGTTLVIRLSNAQGELVGSELVMADAGGNWLATFSGTLLYCMPHHIEISQYMSSYNISSEGGFNMRTYFMPAFGASPFTTPELTPTNIFGTRASVMLQALEHQYDRSVSLSWNDYYDYEIMSISINPSQATL